MARISYGTGEGAQESREFDSQRDSARIAAEQKKAAEVAAKKAAADAQAKKIADEAAAKQAAVAAGLAKEQQLASAMTKPYQDLASIYARERANVAANPALQQLQQAIPTQEGPSAAQAMLAQRANEIGRQQLGAAYARGGSNPAAVRAALMSGGMAQAEAGASGATLRAQETAQFRNEQQAARQAYAQAYLGQQAQLSGQQLAALGGVQQGMGTQLGLLGRERMIGVEGDTASLAYERQLQMLREQLAAQKQMSEAQRAFQAEQATWDRITQVGSALISGGAAAGGAFLGRR